jgi:hypothetical protein
LDKAYCVEDLNIYHVMIAIIFKEHATTFTTNDVTAIHMVNKAFAEVIPKVMRWTSIDFSSLREPRLNYEAQTAIDNHRVEMASAAMLRFGLDPGNLLDRRRIHR